MAISKFDVFLAGAFFLTATLLSAGCASTQPPPPSQSPQFAQGIKSPPPGSHHQSAPPITRPATRPPSGVSPTQPPTRTEVGQDESPAKPQDQRVVTRHGFDRDHFESSAAKTIGEFSELYRANNRPRMVVFLGRELDGEVREWVIKEKFVTPEGETYTAKNNPVSLLPEFTLHARSQLEKGFGDRMRSAGAQMIDLRVIMRNQAAGGDLQGKSDGSLSTKQVEALASANGAEIMIELLMEKRQDKDYVLMARATETQTGLSLGQTDWIQAADYIQSERVDLTTYRAGPDGWEPITRTTHNVLNPITLQEFASYLAVDLMKQVASSWQ
ncbi:MAG: hypothetical protein AAF797_00865 [Planctomycetota bacterium]